MRIPKPVHFLTLLISLCSLNAQPFPEGSITSDFTLKNRRTGEDVSLSSFKGHIIVLDFFAYWCAPCAFSSPDIEENIQKFYHDLGGNPNGVPVQVLAVNIESGNPQLTDDFIEQTQLDLVVDDTEGVAWNLFNQTNGIPLFVIINGVKNSPSHEQWEVLHNAPSYPGAEFLRNIIDQVEAGPDTLDPLENSVDIGEGWKWIDTFGSFQADEFPWVYHEHHGWIYLDEGNFDTGQFIFDNTLDWIWTDRRRYPLVYSFDRNEWLRYEEGTTSPRILVDNSGEKLEYFNTGFAEPVANGFHLNNSTIPADQIEFGGPPKDGIPALTNPEFLSIDQVDYMEDEDILVAVTVGDETRGYPFRILNWHEVVNDRIGEDAFTVTFCPLCGSAVVFESEVNGKILQFGVSGMLYLNNVLMYDRETDSLWSQFMLQSVSGTMQKTRLKWKRSEQLTWADFTSKFPAGKLLSIQTGYTRSYDLDPYARYYASDRPFYFTHNEIRDDLPAKEWVWGILVAEVAKAYPLDQLPDGVAIHDTVNGIALELIHNAAARAVTVTVVETGEPLDNGIGSFWFTWQDFFRDTLVHE